MLCRAVNSGRGQQGVLVKSGGRWPESHLLPPTARDSGQAPCLCSSCNTGMAKCSVLVRCLL